jgi:hypothetical protein
MPFGKQKAEYSLKSFVMKFKNVTVLLLVIACFSGCTMKMQDPYIVRSEKITIDGNTSDWKSVESYEIDQAAQLWVDEELKAENWKGVEDLSTTWRIAWEGQRLFFLFEVTDDFMSDFSQEFTWMNDCIEIHLDPENRSGDRIPGVGEEDPLEDRLGKTMHGSEMHFIPSLPPMIYVDDSRNVFYKDSLQNELFSSDWDGEAVARQTEDGYILEIGFSIPGSVLEPGKIIGLDIAVCDDDGRGRETLMVWSAYKGPFWITMDYFNKMELE